MLKSDLHEDFSYDNSNGLLEKIGFGDLDKQQNAARQNLNQKAKELGFASVEETEKLRELIQLAKQKGVTLETLIGELMSKEQPPEQPENPVDDPERRGTRVKKQYEEAPIKTSVMRERKVRNTKDAVAPAIMLETLYTNIDHQMICQICRHEMPFKFYNKATGNEEYYFECVEIFGRNFLPKEHEAQYLALCPLCAAKYKVFVKNDEEAMATLHADLLTAKVVKGYETSITLDQPAAIFFVEKHLFDLQTILQTILEEKQ